jgi:hypothetical protein
MTVERYIQVQYCIDGNWRVFGGVETPIKCYSPASARFMRDGIVSDMAVTDTLLVWVTKAPCYDRITRQPMMITTYEGIVERTETHR